MNFSKDDRQMMARALELGALGKGSTFSNPPVGAVIARNGRIIGEGWHRRRGESHAEVVAIEDARSRGEKTAGATMFVTLEPCCHRGLTPPCTDAIAAAGISRVVVSCRDDFDERVSGGGIETLRARGIEVEMGLLHDDGAELIEQYRVQRTEKRAFLTIKWAQSLDGRIATKTGDSKWISGKAALRFAHELRAEHGAVAVGANTAIIDDPRLTIREIESHHTPIRIVLIGDKQLPASLSILSDGPKTIVVHSGERPFLGLPTGDVETLQIAVNKDFWRILLARLPKMGIGSMLLEGGGEVITSALSSGAVDKAYVIVAPMIIGEGISAIRDIGTRKLADAIRLDRAKSRTLDNDMLFRGRPVGRPLRYSD